MPGEYDPFAVALDPWDELGLALANPANPAPVAPVDPPPAVVPTPEQTAPDPVALDNQPVAPEQTSELQPGIPIPTETLDSAMASTEKPAPEQADQIAAPPQDSWFYDKGLWGADETDLALRFSRDPLAVEAERREIEGKRADLGSERQAAMLKRDADQAADNQRILREANAATQKAYADVDAEGKRLAQEKVGWASKSAPQKIAGIIAAVVGGLVQGRTGSQRNMGLDMVNQIIEQEVGEHRAKMADVSARKKELAGQFGMNVDRFKTEEALRQSMYEQSARQVEAEMANYDQKGTRFVQLAQFAGQLRAQAAASGQKFAEEDFKRRLELAKHALETDKYALDVRKQDFTERKAAMGAGAGQLMPPEYYAQMGFAKPPVPMSEKQYKSWLATGKASEEYKQAAGQESPERKRQRELGIGGIVDDKGEPVQFRNADFAGKLATSKGAADNAVRLIDKLTRARAKYGWSSDLMRSPEWREMQADYAALQLEKKNTDELGVLAGPDVDIIGRSLGTTDPTELRDPTPGLKAARKNILGQLNSKMRAQAVLPEGRKLPDYDIPYIEPAAPKLDDSDKAYQKAKGDAAYDEGALVDIYSGPNRPRGQYEFDEKQRVRRETIASDTKAYVDGLAANAVSPDEAARHKAVGDLVSLAAQSDTPSVRAYALAKLQALGVRPTGGAQ